MRALIGKFLFHLFGWTLIGEYPGNGKSFVMIVAPHTSNWDVPLGICVKWWQNMRVQFYVKSELFFFPLNLLLKYLGAIPIDRKGNTKFVFQVIKDFKRKKNHRILITPEGTRRKVRKFKSGYYFIAKGAEVPILPVIFDFTKKEIVIEKFFHPTDDEVADQEFIEKIYDGVVGKIPENSFTRTKVS